MASSSHLGEVLPRDVVLCGGEAHDGHLHVVGVAVHFIHCDLLEGGGADDVHGAAHRGLVLLVHV